MTLKQTYITKCNDLMISNLPKLYFLLNGITKCSTAPQYSLG